MSSRSSNDEEEEADDDGENRMDVDEAEEAEGTEKEEEEPSEDDEDDEETDKENCGSSNICTQDSHDSSKQKMRQKTMVRATKRPRQAPAAPAPALSQEEINDEEGEQEKAGNSDSECDSESDREHDGDRDQFDSDIYKNPMCNVNVSKHFRIDVVSGMQKLLAHKEGDGLSHVFVCEGEGSSPPRMMYTIIRVLSYVINSAATSDHIVGHSAYSMVLWKKKVSKTSNTRTLDFLLAVPGGGNKSKDIAESSDTASSICEEDNEEIVRVSGSSQNLVGGGLFDVNMGEMDDEFGLGDVSEKIQPEKIPFGQIRVVPVKGTGSAGGAKITKMFWLVVLKTKEVYDFIKHFCDTLRADPPKDHVARKQFENIYSCAVQILLHAYDWSPSAKRKCEDICKREGSLMPLEHADDRDSLGLVRLCDTFEVYRGMVSRMISAGATEYKIHGFYDTYDSRDAFESAYRDSKSSRAKFMDDFQINRIAQLQAFIDEEGKLKPKAKAKPKPKKKKKAKGTDEVDEDGLGGGDEADEDNGVAVIGSDNSDKKTALQSPGVEHAWGYHGLSGGLGGIPVDILCMCFFDVHETLKAVSTEDEFIIDVGQIPEAASFEIMMNTYDMGIATDDYESMANAKKRFMANPKILTESERIKEFGSLDNMFAGIVMSGHFDTKRIKLLSHIHHSSTTSSVMTADKKVEELKKYLMINLTDHDNIIRSGGLRDKNAQFAIKYIEAASSTIMQSLADLCSHAFGKEMLDPPKDVSDWSFWQTESLDPFAFYAWEHSELHHRVNSGFFLLAPMNFKLYMEMRATHIAYRLGGRQPGWKHIGMMNSVMDGAGLLPYKGEMRITTKSTGSGLDHTRECFCRGMNTYESYLGFKTDHDFQDPDVLRRWTEGSLYDYITSIGNKIINMPADIGRDVFINEQPRDKPEIVEALFHQVPRDDEGNIKLRNTVDLNNTNNRQKTESQPIHGFGPFFNTISKNNMLSDGTEMRYQQMTIVTNPVCSKHMGDENWYRRVYAAGARNNQGVDEPLGAAVAAVGELCSNINKRKRYGTRDVKGPPMTVMQQKLWAPLTYFIQSIAGTPVALSNKLGIWDIPVNYCCHAIVDACYSRICKSFKAFLDNTDQGNVPRYLDVAMCHAVSHTVLKKVYQMMRTHKTMEAARMAAIQSLATNGLHLSQVAPMLHDFVSRITPYPALIVLTTMNNFIRIPVLSLVSVLELLHGRQVSDPVDKEMLSSFLQRALEENMFMPKHPSMEGTPAHGNNITPYITAPWVSGDAMEECTLRCVASQSDNVSMDTIAHRTIVGKMMQKYRTILAKCASVTDVAMMNKLVTQVKGHGYDLSELFGFTHMHDSKTLLMNACGQDIRGMPSVFESGADCDKMFVVRKTTANQPHYALGVRVWDALLFTCLIKRPRMDFGIVNDFAESIVTHLMTTIPTSMMPYEYIPAHHYDSLESCPTQKAFRVGNVGGSHSNGYRPEQMLRNEHVVDFHRNTKFEYLSPGPTNMVEDDGFMAPIIHFQQYLHVSNFWEIPITDWEFDIAWSWDTAFPMMVYCNGDVLEQYCMVTNKANKTVELYRIIGGDDEEMTTSVLQTQFGLDRSRSIMNEAYDDLEMFKSWDGIFRFIKSQSIGPMPFIRRPGVAVRLSDDDDDHRVGCIVVHENGRNGCSCSQGKRCYYCPCNPFYDVLVGANEPMQRLRPFDALKKGVVLAAGTMLLLKPESQEFLAVYSTQQDDSSSSSQKKVLCRLHVPIDLVPKDGFISVSVRVKRGLATKVEVLFVRPEDLVVPGSRSQSQSDVDQAQQYVYPIVV